MTELARQMALAHRPGCRYGAFPSHRSMRAFAARWNSASSTMPMPRWPAPSSNTRRAAASFTRLNEPYSGGRSRDPHAAPACHALRALPMRCWRSATTSSPTRPRRTPWPGAWRRSWSMPSQPRGARHARLLIAYVRFVERMNHYVGRLAMFLLFATDERPPCGGSSRGPAGARRSGPTKWPSSS